MRCRRLGRRQVCRRCRPTCCRQLQAQPQQRQTRRAATGRLTTTWHQVHFRSTAALASKSTEGVLEEHQQSLQKITAKAIIPAVIRCRPVVCAGQDSVASLQSSTAKAAMPLGTTSFMLCNLPCAHSRLTCCMFAGFGVAEELGRTSRTHSSRMRIAALTADNLAAMEPRRRSDPSGGASFHCIIAGADLLALV